MIAETFLSGGTAGALIGGAGMRVSWLGVSYFVRGTDGAAYTKLSAMGTEVTCSLFGKLH